MPVKNRKHKLNNQKVKELISYWFTTSEHSYKTMLGLFDIKRYSDSLFFGHIVLEKILKACAVKQTREQAPYTHDLLQLSELANIDLLNKEIDLLDKMNDFNIRARYPDFKFKFYKKYNNKKYVKKYLEDAVKLYKKLCQGIK
ncbi:MAG: HEPN domain-containing protein [Patescibacteria group bacterium]